MENVVKKDGFSFKFNPNACRDCKGNCCIGESGYIWISLNEIESLAIFLGLSIDEFSKRYLIKVGYRYSLKEKSFQDGYACIFFDENRLRCTVYDVRPNQCKTFPFWNYFKSHLKELERECPGVLV